MNKIKAWIYRHFGKLENPVELDGVLIAIMAFLFLLFLLAMKILVL